METVAKIHDNFYNTFKGLRNWRSKQASTNFIGVFIRPLTAFGYWPEENNKYAKTSRFVQTFGKFWIYILVPFFTITCFVTAYEQRNVSVTDSLYCFLNGCTYLMFVLFATTVSTHGERFKEVVVALETMLALGSRLAEQPRKILQRSQTLAESCVHMYIGATAMFVAMGFGLLVKGLTSRTFAHELWVPYNLTQTPYFEITTFGVHTAMTLGFHLLVIVYGFIFMLLIVAIGQFKLLNHNLLQLSQPRQASRVTCRSQGALGAESVSILPPGNGPSRSLVGRHRKLETLVLFSTNDVEERLGKCIRHHESILSFVSKIPPALDPILVNQLNCSVTPTILSIALLINAEAPHVVVYLVFIPLLGCLLYTWLLCWLAEKISTESELVRDSIFSSDWVGSSARFRHSMRIMISMSNQPTTIRVGGFIPLSHSLFYAIMKLTYTWYMSLTEVQGKLSKPVDKAL